jgi:hypothetical protein
MNPALSGELPGGHADAVARGNQVSLGAARGRCSATLDSGDG